VHADALGADPHVGRRCSREMMPASLHPPPGGCPETGRLGDATRPRERDA
jgi:hypothetical protein